MNYLQAKMKAATCTKCKLCENRAQMVWSKYYLDDTGPDTPAVYMFIGDAPSQADSRVSVPLSDMIIDTLIKKAGIENHYITNTVKCPTPHGRAPFATEMDDCFDYLEAQITEIDPDAIILLGMAANKLLYPGDFNSLRDIVGQKMNVGGRMYMTQYHPNFIKRQSEHVRKTMEDEFVLNLEDLKKAVEGDGSIVFDGVAGYVEFEEKDET